jgi:predicted permease
MTDTLRYAWRSLRSRPGHAALAITIMTLGIGATTAVYAVAQAVLFDALPYRAAERVVFVWDTAKERPLTNLTPGRLLDLRDRATTLAGVAGIGHLSFTLTSSDVAERLAAASVSGNFFDVLQVTPALGRVFTASDADRRQVVLTDALWRTRFGSNRALVGSTIVLDREPYTVAGVLPRDFYWTTIATVPSPGPHPDMFVMAPAGDVPARPVAFSGDPRGDRRTGYLRAVARVKDGVSMASVQAELRTISAQLAREFPETDEGRSAVLVSAREQLLGGVEQPVMLLLAAASLLLAACCANVANLQLMRFSERTRDFVVQAALGADARRLGAQLTLEGTIVSAFAAVFGVAAAAGALASLERFVTVQIPRLASVSVDWRVAAVACALAAASAIGVAWIPILRVRRASAPSLRERDGTVRVSARARRLLVAAEIATAVVLVCGAALFSRSFAQLQRVDVGIRDVDRLLTFNLALEAGRRGLPAAERVAFYDEVLRRIATIPGVQHAATAATLPIGGDTFGSSAIVEGETAADAHAVGYQVVGPGWFATLGVPVLSGRDFTADDTGARGGVLMVNEAFASRFWPGQPAVGRRVKLDPAGEWMTVVGVTGNLRHVGPRQPPRPEVYEPQAQRSISFTVVAVRTAGDPLAIVEPVRRAVASVDRGQPISGVATMGAHLRRAQAEMRSLWSMTTMFGALALVIAALGVYGAIGFTVAQRMREFGVRLALGASPAQLGRHVLAETLMTTAAGVVTGVVLTALGARVVGSLLFETTTADPVSYVTATLSVTAVAVVAGAVPAFRAMRADPVSVLRAI